MTDHNLAQKPQKRHQKTELDGERLRDFVRVIEMQGEYAAAGMLRDGELSELVAGYRALQVVRVAAAGRR
jgi:hypothetical protein